MNGSDIKDKLSGNVDLIVDILQKYGFHNITPFTGKGEIRCSFDDGGNPMGVVVNTENLYSAYYSKNIKGDIFTLIHHKTGYSYGRIVNQFIEMLGGSSSFDITNRKPLFGGVYKDFGITPFKKNQVFNEEIVDCYEKKGCHRFYRDGITPHVQRLFDIRYDYERHCIVIPWRDEFGALVGVKARINFEVESEKMSKYFAIENFYKTEFLYGLNVTKPYIMESGIVLVGESEKFPMQMMSKGYNNSIAIGSHDISECQATQLKFIGYNQIILMFDEDVEEEELIKQCEKLVNGKLFSHKCKIGYVIDKQKKVLRAKESPGDKNGVDIKYLLSECLVWYN